MPRKSQVRGNICGFIQKLWDILENSEFGKVLLWNSSGTSFAILNPSVFEANILPAYFRHSKLKSFVRQLNMYGFRKSHRAKEHLAFSNPDFRRDEESNYPLFADEQPKNQEPLDLRMAKYSESLITRRFPSMMFRRRNRWFHRATQNCQSVMKPAVKFPLRRRINRAIEVRDKPQRQGPMDCYQAMTEAQSPSSLLTVTHLSSRRGLEVERQEMAPPWRQIYLKTVPLMKSSFGPMLSPVVNIFSDYIKQSIVKFQHLFRVYYRKIYVQMSQEAMGNITEGLSKFRQKITSLPISILNFTVPTEHPATTPWEVIAELPLISLSIVEPHLAKAFHFPATKLSLVFDPVSSEPHEASGTLVVVIFPVTIVYQVSLWVVELPLSLHFALHPVTQVVTAVIVDISTLPMPEVLLLLTLITITVGINLTDLHLRPIFGDECPSHSLRISAAGKWIQDLGKTVRSGRYS